MDNNIIENQSNSFLANLSTRLIQSRVNQQQQYLSNSGGINLTDLTDLEGLNDINI